MSDWINFPENPEKYVGVIYLIENLVDEKWYIGKKQLLKKTRLKANKSRKRDKIVWKDNDTLNYYGSSVELLRDVERLGKSNFRRTVIECCDSKWHMSFAELIWQLECKALTDPRSYNGIINVRLNSPPKSYIDIERKRNTIGL